MLEKKELKRSLGLIDSTAIVIGSMVGSGIFIVSADMARILGCPGLLILAWVITGIVTIIAALSYGELAAMMPHAGGQYIYLKEAYGKLPAFLYGWTLFTVMHSGTIAAVAIAFAKFAGVIFPIISSSNWIIKITSIGKYNIGLNTENLIAIISIIFLTWINTKGIESGKWIQNSFTFTKFLALVGLIILGLFIGKNIDSITLNVSNIWSGSWSIVKDGLVEKNPLSGISVIGALGAAMVGSFFSSSAWDTVTYTAGEIKDPKKNIPLSLAIGTTIVILLYILVNFAYLSILPLIGNPNGLTPLSRGIQFASNDRVGTATLEVIFGNSGAITMAILIMVSTFGCNNGIILSTARVYYAMAIDGLFFKKAALLNKYSVPEFALIMQCIWSCLLCVTGTYGDLLDYVVFTWLLFYSLTISALFALRIKKPNEERPYKAIGYPVLPLIYILFALWMSLDLLIYKPLYTWPGLIIVFLGIPIYFTWKDKITWNQKG